MPPPPGLPQLIMECRADNIGGTIDAIRFYERFGASISPGWLNGELTKEQLHNLAAQ